MWHGDGCGTAPFSAAPRTVHTGNRDGYRLDRDVAAGGIVGQLRVDLVPRLGLEVNGSKSTDL